MGNQRMIEIYRIRKRRLKARKVRWPYREAEKGAVGKKGDMEIWWGKKPAKKEDLRQARRDGDTKKHERRQTESKKRWKYGGGEEQPRMKIKRKPAETGIQRSNKRRL